MLVILSSTVLAGEVYDIQLSDVPVFLDMQKGDAVNFEALNNTHTLYINALTENKVSFSIFRFVREQKPVFYVDLAKDGAILELNMDLDKILEGEVDYVGYKDGIARLAFRLPTEDKTEYISSWGTKEIPQPASNNSPATKLLIIGAFIVSVGLVIFIGYKATEKEDFLK